MEGLRDGEAWPLLSPRSPDSPRHQGLAAERVHDAPPDARPPQAQRRRVDNNVARQLQFQVEELSLDSPSAAMGQDIAQRLAEMRRAAAMAEDAASQSDSAVDPGEDAQPPPARLLMAAPVPNREVPQEPGPFAGGVCRCPWCLGVGMTIPQSFMRHLGATHEGTAIDEHMFNLLGGLGRAACTGPGCGCIRTPGRHTAMPPLWAESGSPSARGKRCHPGRQRGSTARRGGCGAAPRERGSTGWQARRHPTASGHRTTHPPTAVAQPGAHPRGGAREDMPRHPGRVGGNGGRTARMDGH